MFMSGWNDAAHDVGAALAQPVRHLVRMKGVCGGQCSYEITRHRIDGRFVWQGGGYGVRRHAGQSCEIGKSSDSCRTLAH